MKNIIALLTILGCAFSQAASFNDISCSISQIPVTTSESTEDSSRQADQVKIDDCVSQAYCKQTVLRDVNLSVEEYLITGEISPFLHQILIENNIPQNKYDESIIELYEWLDHNL